MGRRKSGRRGDSGGWKTIGCKGNKGKGDDEERRNGGRCRLEDAGIPIGVRSRLTYPLVEPCLTKSRRLVRSGPDDEGEDESEDESVVMEIRPRFVFVSSLCAVCSRRSRLFCERCRMVSYCSGKHRTRGLAKHQELCAPLREIACWIASTLGCGSAVVLDPEEYRVYRLELLALLESRIGRPLELWEKEIVLYPRVCRLCRRFSENGICCADCGMEIFCAEHSGEHKRWCEQFRVYQRFLFLQRNHDCVAPKIPNVHERMSVASPERSFDELMREVYGNCSYYREMDCYTYCTLSHMSTIPLTALYSMQISCPEWESKTEWIVHVVGAEFQFEGVNLRVWEKLFLHFVPNLRRLRLVLIGPEFRLPSGVPRELLSAVQVCNACQAAGKAVYVSFKPETLYHEFVRDASESFGEPDLICTFNPGLYRMTGFAGKDTWLETISEFCRKSVPVAVTSYTADEMLWEIERINSIGNIEVLLEPRQNPFASIKPDRNFVTDQSNPLIYKNYYIAVIKAV
ncbi:uncharacterized protein LOC143428933 [Xylocopa sonorina]|uniref:uncharacterized protein LOC143428933 n=1 Tax=Xylocopa sonorina TaxID=1818115 RepID=UPI00403AE2FA